MANSATNPHLAARMLEIGRVDRGVAEKLNPLIGGCGENTLENVSGMLSDLGHMLSTAEDPVVERMWLLLGTMSGALDYEIAADAANFEAQKRHRSRKPPAP